MLRQLFISLVLVAAAAVAYVMFVPGAPQTLARFGIVLPGGDGVAASTGPAGTGEARGGPGGAVLAPGGAPRGPGGGGRGPGRTLVVVTAPVTYATINDRLTAIGEGAAAHSVTVVSPAAGTLVQLLVRPGDLVRAGDVIGHLDSEAEAIAVERARLAFADAERALARTRGLAEANNATTVQVATAELALENARLALQNAELDLKRRSISTPIAGRVGLFQVSPGNAVTGQTVVTTIEDTSHITVSFWVPERYAPAIEVGMPIEASAVALPGESLGGTIRAVDNRIDPASRTLKVEAEIANPTSRLRPGMSFSARLTFPGERFPSVDPLAIQWSSAGAYLWKYVDGKVERVSVEIIQRNSDGVMVKGDLAEGDQIVTQGVQQLTAGATVRLLDEPAAGGGGPPRAGRSTDNPS